jgi:hypothetical protein
VATSGKQARITKCRAEGHAVDEVTDWGGGGDGWVIQCIPDQAEFGPERAIDVMLCGGPVEGTSGVCLIEQQEPGCLRRG